MFLRSTNKAFGKKVTDFTGLLGNVNKNEEILKTKFSFQKLYQNIRAFVVTSTQNQRLIRFFNTIEILNKYKIFQDQQITKFSNNIDSRKLDFLSP